MTSATLSATEFKAKCLEILDRVSRRELKRVVIAKRDGTAVAVLSSPEPAAAKIKETPGLLRRQAVIPPGTERGRASFRRAVRG